MKEIQNLKDLLIEQGRELYSAEKQVQDVLPKLEKHASTPELKKAIKDHITKTRKQQERIEKAFNELKSSPEGEFCEPLGSMINKSNQLINRTMEASTRDAGIISSLQHINHYKIAGYGTAAEYAKNIGNKTVGKLIHEALDDEKRIDESFSKLAQKEINKKAAKKVVMA